MFGIAFVVPNAGSKLLFLRAWLLKLSINLFKSPFIVFLTFRVDATTARIDQEADRERRRQLEIQEAKERRNRRIARQLAMQDIGLFFKGLVKSRNYLQLILFCR